MRSLALWLVLGLVCACGVPKGSVALGGGCDHSVDCISAHCSTEGLCVRCDSNGDCVSGEVCSTGGRFLGGPGGPSCISADAGCASTPSECPTGFMCITCASGATCNDATGECSQVYVPPPAVCGSADFSNGFDAGFGPGPDVSGANCDSCIGCPHGSECVCGASGIIGGVRCTNAGDALACFITGGVGYCEVFSGDCATNTQCQGLPATPLCNSYGNCVQCLRDTDCPQDAGLRGCIDGQCSRCCTSNSDCPPAGPECVDGFCYACTKDGGCSDDDAGVDAGASDGGATDAGDGG